MNKILRTLLCGGQLSLTIIDVTRLVNDAIKIHGTDAQASRVLGGLLACGAYLGAQLKNADSCVSLTVKAKDGDGAVSVSSDGELHVRGYADGSCTRTLVGGTLSVVREDGGAMPFVGTCEITSDNISDIFSEYFQISEQIPTAVAINVDMGVDGSCLSAGGVIMQLLPDADEDAVNDASEAFYLYCDESAPLTELGAEGIYEKFFSHLGKAAFYELSPVYKCNCSKEKIESVLASVGREELIKLAEEQGAVTVHCHYCNKDYVYDKQEIEKAFK